MEEIEVMYKRVWDTFDRMSAERAEAEKKAAERAAEYERQAAERKAEIDKINAEAAERKVEYEKQAAERKAEIDKIMAETEKIKAKTERIKTETAEKEEEYKKQEAERKAEAERDFIEIREAIKKNSKLLGNISENNGMIAEEYFFNSFERGQTNFFGETFDDIEKNAKGWKKGFKDEYDILMTNGSAVGIIEVKHKAHKNDLPDVFKKAETFRGNFPEYQNHRIYLGLASMAFYPELEKACKESGIAIIKQKGENIVINDKHLKVY